MKAMTPEIKIAGFVSVCSFCYPGETLFVDYPWLEGNKLSHGICEYHAQIQRNELAAMLKKGVAKSQFAA